MCGVNRKSGHSGLVAKTSLSNTKPARVQELLA